ncbi:hypothetical protein [Lysobacter sp. Hz 25]|uniref:hypothetical protein n=1 Tax=Lysobacter sp. Hz 25 TaxID=3383698 RepID=UPI0038D4180B
MKTSKKHGCEKCGGLTETRKDGSVEGIYCTVCDWAMVTTSIPAISRDTGIYEVRVVGGDFTDNNQVKIISRVSGVNFLDARKLLAAKGSLVFRGRADKVFEVREALRAGSIPCEISPSFNY